MYYDKVHCKSHNKLILFSVYFVPVEPNPPVPLFVSFRHFTSSNLGYMILSHIN